MPREQSTAPIASATTCRAHRRLLIVPAILHRQVLVSAHVIVALQSVVSRSVPSAEQAVVSVTTIHGGEAHNVIPDTVCGAIRPN